MNNSTRGAGVPVRSMAEDVGAHYLIFMCDGQQYGVEIHRIQEIRGWECVMRFPRSEEFAVDLMNLRGSTIPIVNFRRCFGLEAARAATYTVVMVVFTGDVRSPERVGLLVDAVSEVHYLRPDSTPPPTEFETFPRRAFVSGIASIDDRMVMLLDVDELVEAWLSSEGAKIGKPRLGERPLILG
jgi:purine-binding chemotaxis protein CheW